MQSYRYTVELSCNERVHSSRLLKKFILYYQTLYLHILKTDSFVLFRNKFYSVVSIAC